MNRDPDRERALAIEALGKLNGTRADERDSWLRVGMALHSADSGLLEDWDRWSSQSEKYQPNECARQWRSFKAGKANGVGLGSLITWARDDSGDAGFGKSARTRDRGTSKPSKSYPSLAVAIEAAASMANGTHAATWEYKGADGTTVLWVARINEVGVDANGKRKKTFRPIHQTSAGFQFGDPPGLLPLYRLGDLAPSGPVFVVEGEKAADAGAGIGLDTTTSAHGAQSPAKTDWDPLVGRDVVVLPDNDRAGKRYAERVVAILGKPGAAASVRIAELPGLTAGGDLFDFVALRRDAGVEAAEIAKEIRVMCEQSPSLTPCGDNADSSAVAATPASSGEHRNKLTDTGNAERLTTQFGANVRHCHVWKKWLVWGGDRWRLDERGELMQRSKDVARSIYGEAAKCRDKDERDSILSWAHISESAERRKAMIELARSEGQVPIGPEQLDQHPNLLNCSNGTLDLNTFELRAHRREDYQMKVCPTRYDPNAQCPMWHKFLARVLPDDRVRNYVHALLGYCLTGEVTEQILAVFVGDGSNGKSTLLYVVQKTLGPGFAIQIISDLLLAKDHASHPTEIADLFGIRLAVGVETRKGRALDEVLVKQLTGGERIRARRMREDFWEFEPTHKFILATNHQPKITVGEYSIERRLHIVPFEVRISGPELDKKLSKKLLQERMGILAWMVDGCRRWRADGLHAPEALTLVPSVEDEPKSSTEEFVDGHVVREPSARVRASALYDAFCRWCEQTNRGGVSQREFGIRLGHLSLGSKKTNGITVYLGARLRDPGESSREDQGREGPSSPLNALEKPHDGVNGVDGPFPPQSSPEVPARPANVDCLLAEKGLAPDACPACGSTRHWRLRSDTPWVCGTCYPPSVGAENVQWSEPEASSEESGDA